jgi:hypothetical protein
MPPRPDPVNLRCAALWAPNAVVMGARHGRRYRARCGSRVSVAASSEEVDDDGDKGRGATFVSLFSTGGGGGGDVLCARGCVLAAATMWVRWRPCGGRNRLEVPASEPWCGSGAAARNFGVLSRPW